MSVHIRNLILLLISFLTLPVSAQKLDARPIAAITGGNVWLYGLDGTGLKVSNGGGFHDPLWSPNGNVLAFVGPAADASPNMESIYITDWMGNPPIPLITGNMGDFPVSFAPDGHLVYGLVVNPETTPGTLSQQTVEVYHVLPQAGAVPEFLGSFAYTAGCARDADYDPSEYHYRNETGRLSLYPTVLAATPWGVVHSTGCLESDQVLTLGSEQATAYGYASFLPQDRSQVFSLLGNNFSRVNGAQVLTEYVPSGLVDRLGFGPPGSMDIYYTTRTLTGTLILPDSVLAAFAERQFYPQLNRYSVSIHRLSRATGLDTELYTADAYGIGSLYGLADGSGIVFSQIPNPDEWVEALSTGRISPQDIAAGNTKTDEYSVVELYQLDFGTGQGRRVGTDMNTFVLNTVVPSGSAGVMLTPLPTVIAPTTTPPAFAIDTQVMVNPELAALNVRATPDTTAAVVEVLPPGAVLTILEGPVEAVGYTWWRVRLPSTAEGWVVENTGELPAILPSP